jgi:hypothetical protein
MKVSDDLLDLLGCMAEDEGSLPHETALTLVGADQIRAAVLAGLIVNRCDDGYALTERGQPLGDIGRRMRLAPRLHQQTEAQDTPRAAHLRSLYLIEAEDHLERL